MSIEAPRPKIMSNLRGINFTQQIFLGLEEWADRCISATKLRRLLEYMFYYPYQSHGVKSN